MSRRWISVEKEEEIGHGFALMQRIGSGFIFVKTGR
jgi:hypothetical protein